jgi:hypothetical protein
MAVTRRVYLYGIALVALGMLVAGLSGLLQVVLERLAAAVVGQPTTVGADLLRGRVSFAGALAAIGLLAWGIHWGLADRPPRRGGAEGAVERRAAIRKLFLYLALFLGGLVLLLAGRALLTDLALALFGRLTASSVLAGAVVHPLAVVLVGGAFWAYYARVAAHDRRAAPEVGAGATLRRWCVYSLSFVGLLVLLFAAADLLRALWEAAAVSPGAATSGDWLAVAVASALGGAGAGLALWSASWSWSTAWLERPAASDPESRSVLRKVYLYLVLAVAVAWTVWNVGRVLYELLRAALLPERLAGGGWGLLHAVGAPVATALVFGLAWAYHARVVGREAARVGEPRRQATIRWFYGYLVALVGLVVLAVGLGGTLSTLLDLLVQPAAVRPTRWWEERISLFATLVAVGLPIWVAYWGRLQREASDPLARESLVRRIYLFLVFGVAVLTLLGSGAFTLYQVIRLALGEPWSAAATSELLAAASAAAVAGLFLAYHLRVFRAGAAPPPPTSHRPASPAHPSQPPLPPLVPPPLPLGEGRAEGVPPSLTPQDWGAVPGRGEGSSPAPLVAVAVVRATDAAALARLQAELAARAPAGGEVELVPLDAATAARVAAALSE